MSKIVLDTSVIINGLFTAQVESGNIRNSEIIIPQAVIDELQSQASQKKEQGFLGLNEIKNVFIHDRSNILKNLTSDSSSSTTIIAKNGIVEEKKMILFNGQIITSNKKTLKDNIIKFEQLNIDLKNLNTGTIKQPKLQETPTYDLIKCMLGYNDEGILNCAESAKEEITTVLNRRMILPFYIPIISLVCSFLLIKNKSKKSFFLNKYSIFILSFFILLYAELIIRFTGISPTTSILFITTPFFIIPIIYSLLIFKLNRENS